VDTLGAAVHHSLHTVTLRRFQHVSRPGYFDIPVHAVGFQEIAEWRGQMIDDVAPGYALVNRIGIAYRAGDQIRAKLRKLCIEQTRVLIEGPHLVAVCKQPANQM
jgi:hypothetical protein